MVSPDAGPGLEELIGPAVSLHATRARRILTLHRAKGSLYTTHPQAIDPRRKSPEVIPGEGDFHKIIGSHNTTLMWCPVIDVAYDAVDPAVTERAVT